jgi:alpha-beta hydrolase superfamily lysophospholipase
MDTGLTLHRTDGHQAACYRWSHGGAPRAVLVVAHGMGEHALRYRPALAGLIDSGVAIYAIDHRGHGATMALTGGVAGDFGPGGFAAVVEDLATLVRRARADHPDLPLFLLGHSMGSFIAQAFLIDHGALINGAVLVGTTAVDRLANAMAREPDAMAALNRPFEPARTQCDWLSRDPAQVDAYLADPLCGFALVPDSMLSLLSQGERLADPKALAHIPANLPLSILVGGNDVLITHFGALEPLVDRYRAVGLAPEVTLYPDARHEILNETNRADVTGDLSIWIDRNIEARFVHA